MKIATILPTKYLNLEAESDYHMCLAHLMDIPEYKKFFEWQTARGAHVIMDNGVVETGESMPIMTLLKIAQEVGVTEMSLPDVINNRMLTKHAHTSALEVMHACGRLSSNSSQLAYSMQKVMAIPQGCDQQDWINSVNDMLMLAKHNSNNVTAIGISKFCVGDKLFKDRLEALASVPELLESNLDIHLLGCPNNLREVWYIANEYTDRIRGVDSGLSVFYTQAAKILTASSNRPKGVELDFNQIFTTAEIVLLKRNIKEWKRIIHDRIIVQWRCEG